jgi:hypothetical protein
MTWKELAAKINSLPPERQEDTVTISLDIMQECIPAAYVCQVSDEDWALGILDKGHFVIAVEA